MMKNFEFYVTAINLKDQKLEKYFEPYMDLMI
ncbi:MAG: hypothetical protein RIT35_236 [Pseudomonadota bacterium]|jgi:hypothetical protein